MITELNHETLSMIRTAIDEQLKPLERTLGIKLSPGKIVYGAGTFCVKMDGTLMKCGTGQSGQAVEFKRVALASGIPPEWYGKKVRTSHGTATITQIMTQNRKFPIIADIDDGSGRRVKLAEEYVRFNLI